MDPIGPMSNRSSFTTSRRAFLGALASGLAGACVNRLPPAEYAPPIPGLAGLLADQASIYPLMMPRDLYKLIGQATLGPSEFFIGTESGCLRGLLSEIAQLMPAIHDGEREYETLSRERGLVRVNLRPYLQRGGKAEELARAICMTGRDYRGSFAEFVASLDAVVPLIDDASLSFNGKAFANYVEKMREAKFPHGGKEDRHSGPYAVAYRPAYRIVLAEYITDPLYGGRRDLYEGS